MPLPLVPDTQQGDAITEDTNVSTNAQDRASLLRSTAQSFCTSLLNAPAPKELLKTHFVPSSSERRSSNFSSGAPRITEHGPEWAKSRLPFLGRQFTGSEQCEEYFSLLSSTLKMQLDEHSFPPSEQFIVDPEAETTPPGSGGGKGVVIVVGKGKFESIKTGKAWNETFIYRLSEFDMKGRIGHWEIWADPLSAWAAVGGEGSS